MLRAGLLCVAACWWGMIMCAEGGTVLVCIAVLVCAMQRLDILILDGNEAATLSRAGLWSNLPFGKQRKAVNGQSGEGN